MRGHGGLNGLRFGQHPRLIVKSWRGHGLVHADDRDVSVRRDLANRRGQRVDDLLVVAKELDFMLSEEVLLERDVFRSRIYTVHDVGLKDERGENIGAHRLEKIVRDWLRDRNG